MFSFEVESEIAPGRGRANRIQIGPQPHFLIYTREPLSMSIADKGIL